MEPVEKHKNAHAAQAATIALMECADELGKIRSELQNNQAVNAAQKAVLYHVLHEAYGFRPGDADKLVEMAKGGGAEEKQIKGYLEKIVDEREG